MVFTSEGLERILDKLLIPSFGSVLSVGKERGRKGQ
jgi:hypothetical protein